MTLPTSRDIPAITRSMDNAVRWLNLHGASALTATISKAPSEPMDRARVHESDGGRSTPTEGPALAQVDREVKLAGQQAELRHTIASVNEQLGVMVAQILAITGLATQAPSPASGEADVTYCAELYCEDESDGRHGRCNACWAMLDRKAKASGRSWQEHSPLPAVVFEERRARREGRKAVTSTA